MARSRRLLTICTIGAFAGVIVFFLCPVNNTFFRLAFLGSLLGAWVGITFFTWRFKAARSAAMALPFLLAIPFLLPGDEIKAGELHSDYLRRLTGYEGVSYFWGGESSLGIDCSGLPRRAFRDALLDYGIRHGNGRAFRSWLEQWWFDASARALSEGYRDYTAATGADGKIRTMDYAPIEPGDLAITATGIHALVYAGEGKWIQADPGLGIVATLEGRTVENPWFRVPVTIHRWRIFDSQPKKLE